MAIETPARLLVAGLRATGRPVYPVNPMAVARYRDRHSVAGRKSDHGDAVVLAGVLRTDIALHRPLPADTELAQAIAVLARAQQDAVWDRTQAHNRLRSHLREYFPAFLAAFAAAKGGIMRPEARTILAAAPTPGDAAKLTLTQLRALLKKAGRSRGLDTEATRLRDGFRAARYASSPSSKPPWAGRPWPCSASSTPPAPAPITSSAPPPIDGPLPRALLRVDYLDHPQRQPGVLIGLLDDPVAFGFVEIPQLLDPARHVSAGREHRLEDCRE